MIEIYQIFPEPVYFSKLERSLTKEELNIINKFKNETHNNAGQQTTNEDHVLNKKTLKNLKEDINKIVIDYFNKVVCTSNSITPYITQSWINYTETNQFLHAHAHPNSYLSGVFYVAADKEVDKIQFSKNSYKRIVLTVSKNNIFNSLSWWHTVETGNVILFPSNLIHGVENKKGTNGRISLAFNVFFRGKIGSKKAFTELVIN